MDFRAQSAFVCSVWISEHRVHLCVLYGFQSTERLPIHTALNNFFS